MYRPIHRRPERVYKLIMQVYKIFCMFVYLYSIVFVSVYIMAVCVCAGRRSVQISLESS